MEPSRQAEALLDKLVSNVRKSFQDDRTILSFDEYFSLLVSDPERQLRSSAQYLVDMMHHFGTSERDLPTGKVTRFNLFDAEFAEGEGRVAGQEKVQESLYRVLANFAREGRVNKLILMHGPNGSAKSSICRAMMRASEHYSRLPEGATYKFNWIFPSDKVNSDKIGFGADQTEHSGESFAFLSAEHIDARVPCDMHDHPVFLIPQGQRIKLMRDLLPEPHSSADTRSAAADQDGDSPADAPDLDQDGKFYRPKTTISEYLRFGDLCYKCRRIYDALLASYDGDVSKVLNHIQVERFFLSRRYRHGIATIEPQVSVDARIQQVTQDRSLAALPKALQHTSIYQPSGPLVDANRGLLEYSDLLKRPVEAFKYLLATVETATVSMESFVLHLDMVYLASTNETYLDAFKDHPDFPSFKGRMELVKVPFLMRYETEKEIYAPQITPRIVGRHVAPHAIDIAAFWAVLTRMRRSDASLYPKEVATVLKTLTPVEKLHLYDTGKVPKRLTTREGRELRRFIGDIYNESSSYPNYEGRFGASAREIRSALLNAAHHEDYKCLSPLAVLEELQGILSAKSVYEFLKQEVVGKYHDHGDFLNQTRELYLHWADAEVRDAVGLAKKESHSELFSRYVTHISHWVKREKMLDPTSGDYVDPDASLMNQVERVLITDGENAEDFRRAVIGTIGAKALEAEEPSQAPDYASLFRNYIERLEEHFYEERSGVVSKIYGNFLEFMTHGSESLDPKEVEVVRPMLKRLKTDHGYCNHCAQDTVAYLMNNKYSK